MKPLVDKKYIFARKLDGKPIEVDSMTKALCKRYHSTRALFYETGIFRKIDWDNHGRNTELTHEIHFTVPRCGKEFINIIEPCTFASDTYGPNDKHFLP